MWRPALRSFCVLRNTAVKIGIYNPPAKREKQRVENIMGMKYNRNEVNEKYMRKIDLLI